MRIDRLARNGIEAAARSSIDAAVAGPLPEHVVRTLVEQRVLERVLAEAVADADEESRRQLEAAANRVVDWLLASGTIERLLDEVVESGAVRRATNKQTSSGLDAIRRRIGGWDDRFERAVRRRRRDEGTTPYAGVATRATALVVDAVVVNLAFVAGVGSVALVSSLVHAHVGAAAAAVAMGATWTLLTLAYFAGAWSLAGQTVGMRLLGIRVVDPSGKRPSLLRSTIRSIWLLVAVAPLLLGSVPALFDARRRCVQDLIARTTVVRDDQRAAAGS